MFSVFFAMNYTVDILVKFTPWDAFRVGWKHTYITQHLNCKV
jgi:hypothetical protein